MSKNQHVIPLGTGWAVKKAGSKRFSLIADNKRDALNFAKEIAKNNKSELIVHGKDGKIQRKNSFFSK